MSIGRVMLAAIVVIVVVGIPRTSAFLFFGVTVELDGP